MAGRFLVSLAALGLLSAPLAAQATERPLSPVAAHDELGGEGSIARWVLGIGLFAGVLTWIILDSSDDDNGEAPASP